MFEKVNPAHPDKVADRIAGAIVDIAYKNAENPRIAVEVLIGHGECFIIAETSEHIAKEELSSVVGRIAGNGVSVKYIEVPQDVHLANNQSGGFRCGDNGIFKGVPVSGEEFTLSGYAREIYGHYGTDGKYIISDNGLIICQSNADKWLEERFPYALVNPLGDWTGGTDVDTGAVNRKLGSDMGRAVTGGGLHGKDLSKADVSVNIYAHILAQKRGEEVNLSCAIGDRRVDGRLYSDIVDIAREYVAEIGGFEKLAEWGLI